ncbi:MAG: pyruvate/2-oxoglutarate dehydrogenase complex,dihydrolipoamide dehydrogenase (E3) component [Cyanobacteria bacterium QH_8_48_120]|jgi:hypothetical protein|nr:MAG: pyruvate/2-oxoglutarate dehydrogenase complex,dihydrolipoamide dehydrogenase (E3) component [Cyanobacteria bacterium QH_1_48_107]PSO58900.1 MAG: pyruvate/2-oxoglutarate dehydrogenase complex,dihydrolipoamide dehydrogenase (E3) component [Cyanobacteria bacterium QH_10_48_56]PSO64021.1 MAG: pyruvate/2-oxoglutarate dehydrogenase complex,dihydrolipoamide dehydrogenase (E3) component [Cyanobacteria bacterium QH_7_48_89]PSO65014.1 MAG: pyruvate/2-oxoglutarate dehydrogenase complex,dihydrolipoa
MKILDSQGRIFGKVSILDLGAALVILLAIIGIFFFPGTSGSVAQVSGKKPIEVDIIVQGLRVSEPDALMGKFRQEKKTNIIIRNQPYGQVEIKSVQPLPNVIAVPQPNGSIETRPDPTPVSKYSTSMLLTMGGKAQITESGPVLGNNKIKIGTPIELEGFNYNFNASVVDVRIQE